MLKSIFGIFDKKLGFGILFAVFTALGFGLMTKGGLAYAFAGAIPFAFGVFFLSKAYNDITLGIRFVAGAVILFVAFLFLMEGFLRIKVFGMSGRPVFFLLLAFPLIITYHFLVSGRSKKVKEGLSKK